MEGIQAGQRQNDGRERLLEPVLWKCPNALTVAPVLA